MTMAAAFSCTRRNENQTEPKVENKRVKYRTDFPDHELIFPNQLTPEESADLERELLGVNTFITGVLQDCSIGFGHPLSPHVHLGANASFQFQIRTQGILLAQDHSNVFYESLTPLVFLVIDEALKIIGHDIASAKYISDQLNAAGGAKPLPRLDALLQQIKSRLSNQVDLIEPDCIGSGWIEVPNPETEFQMRTFELAIQRTYGRVRPVRLIYRKQSEDQTRRGWRPLGELIGNKGLGQWRLQCTNWRNRWLSAGLW